jgi:hypothetical protein
MKVRAEDKRTPVSTRDCFPMEVKRRGREADHSQPFGVWVKKVLVIPLLPHTSSLRDV